MPISDEKPSGFSFLTACTGHSLDPHPIERGREKPRPPSSRRLLSSATCLRPLDLPPGTSPLHRGRSLEPLPIDLRPGGYDDPKMQLTKRDVLTIRLSAGGLTHSRTIEGATPITRNVEFQPLTPLSPHQGPNGRHPPIFTTRRTAGRGGALMEDAEDESGGGSNGRRIGRGKSNGRRKEDN